MQKMLIDVKHQNNAFCLVLENALNTDLLKMSNIQIQKVMDSHYIIW